LTGNTILYSGELRRAEITKLNLSDYDAEKRMLRVQGERSKERSFYLGLGAVATLQAWLEMKGDENGPLSLTVNKGNNFVMDNPLTLQGIYYLLKRRAKSASVKRLIPHDFRCTFVGDLLDGGVDIAIVAKMAGHARVDTTARYAIWRVKVDQAMTVLFMDIPMEVSV
jgi:site-specific recombinase XerD